MIKKIASIFFIVGVALASPPAPSPSGPPVSPAPSGPPADAEDGYYGQFYQQPYYGNNYSPNYQPSYYTGTPSFPTATAIQTPPVPVSYQQPSYGIPNVNFPRANPPSNYYPPAQSSTNYGIPTVPFNTPMTSLDRPTNYGIPTVPFNTPMTSLDRPTVSSNFAPPMSTATSYNFLNNLHYQPQRNPTSFNTYPTRMPASPNDSAFPGMSTTTSNYGFPNGGPAPSYSYGNPGTYRPVTQFNGNIAPVRHITQNPFETTRPAPVQANVNTRAPLYNFTRPYFNPVGGFNSMRTGYSTYPKMAYPTMTYPPKAYPSKDPAPENRTDARNAGPNPVRFVPYDYNFVPYNPSYTRTPYNLPAYTAYLTNGMDVARATTMIIKASTDVTEGSSKMEATTSAGADPSATATTAAEIVAVEIAPENV